MSAARLFHLVEPGVWAAAVAAGVYRPPSIDTEGFVHFSFADQVAGTANLLYRDRRELLVVEVDAGRLAAPLRVEDSYGTGTEFPHVYGAVPTSAAVAVQTLARDPSGDWTFPPGAVSR